MVAMTIVLSAACVTAKNMTPEQRACCASMKHDCGGTAIAKGCCSGEAVTFDRLPAGAAATLLKAPLPVLVAVLETPRLSVPALRTFNGAGRFTASPPGPPPYLLAPTLRI